MFGAHSPALAVVSVQVSALLLSSLTEGELTSYVTVHDRRKYFVSEQPTSPDFLECGGAYDNGEKGLAIHLMLYRDQDRQTPPATMTKSGSTAERPQRYTYSCSDERLVNGGGAPISNGSCKFGVMHMSMEFSGRYDCLVQSAGTGSLASSSSEVLLEIYGKASLRCCDGSGSNQTLYRSKHSRKWVAVSGSFERHSRRGLPAVVLLRFQSSGRHIVAHNTMETQRCQCLRASTV